MARARTTKSSKDSTAHLGFEAKLLATLRDTLLPKLLRGEIQAV